MNFTYKYTKWVLLALTIIAGILRYFTLTDTSFNLEEQIFWFCGTKNNFFESLLLFAKLKPFNLILSISTWITCWEGLYVEIINRSIAIITGIIAVPLIFVLARKFYSEVEGIIAAGFIAFSWNCIYTSQNISEYSLLLMFGLLYFIALITFLDRITEENYVPKQENIFLIITGLLLGFTSIYGILIVIISFFYTFFFITKIKIFIKTIIRFLYIIIPLGLLTWWALHQNIIYTNIKYNITDYINFINYIIANNYFLSIIIIVPIFYMLFVYLKRLFNKDEFGEDAKTKFNNSTLIISIWFVSSIIGFVLLIQLVQIKFYKDDLIFILPPLFILIARGIVLISSKLNYQIIISVMFGLQFFTSTIINLNIINDKAEYNSAVRYIKYAIKDDSNNKYGILITGIEKSDNFVISNEAFTYYLKKNNIKNDLLLFTDVVDIMEQAKEMGLNYLWFIADNDYTDTKIIAELRSKKLIQSGYRYKKIIIYILEVK